MDNRELYLNAIEDAKISEEDEIFPLYELHNGENILLSWNNFPAEFAEGSTYIARKKPQLWCIALEELQNWYRDNKEGVTNWNERLEQLIGLPENYGYTHFTAFGVLPSDVIRPAYQIDPQKQITADMFDGSALGQYEEWFRENEKWSYREAEWPWTRLGYTYDWAEGHEQGLTEFIILPGREINVKWTVTTAELIKMLEDEGEVTIEY